MSAEYLIVGQGIAGSVLAWTLHQRGKSVLLVGDARGHASSFAAGGVFNPLTGRKLVRTWNADRLFPFLRPFYRAMETELGVTFVHEVDVYRPYRSIEEQNSYLAQTAEPGFQPYVRTDSDDEQYRPYIHNPYGGLTVTQAGWVDASEMITAIRSYFQAKGCYIDQPFSYEALEVRPDEVRWEGRSFRKLIFCEGPLGNQSNPYFNWLPYNPVKGQLLAVEIDEYPIQNIVNQGIFILPYRDNVCRVGATYTWHDLNWQTTEEGKQFLEEKLKALLKVPYRIVDLWAGIRPATRDRRPLIGLHPEHPAVGIFNGLGAKGVSLAPYLADEFATFLEGGKDLNPEVNISRCFSLYYR